VLDFLYVADILITVLWWLVMGGDWWVDGTADSKRWSSVSRGQSQAVKCVHKNQLLKKPSKAKEYRNLSGEHGPFRQCVSKFWYRSGR